MRSWLEAVLIAPSVALGIGAVLFGCSLSNISRSDCASDAECVSAFGVGSTCSKGFCTESSGCETGHDCRRLAGGGACVNHACVAKIPEDACMRSDEPPEPPDLYTTSLTGKDAPLVIGSIFALEADRDKALTQSVRLAVREINQSGLPGGQKLGVVFCDNGGALGATTGAERDALDLHATDYLAGTLGVPYIVGPRTSGDAIQVVNRIKKNGIPTAVIAPSATSPALTTIDDRLSAGDPYGLFWRTCPNDELQGKVLAENVIGLLPAITKVTVVYIHDAYGDGLAQVFQNVYGISKTSLVPYDDTTPDDDAALAKLVADADGKNGDAVLLISHYGTTSLKIINAMAGLPIAGKRFFFTDGSMDTSLLDPTLPTWIQDILKAAKGTAPASPSGQEYEVFKTNLNAEFGLDATSASFLAHAYDATYVGAFGAVHAGKGGVFFDGRGVAEGMARLSMGDTVRLNGVNGWTSGSGLLVQKGNIDILGTSGELDFDASTGEAPGRILIWSIAPDLASYNQDEIVSPD